MPQFEYVTLSPAGQRVNGLVNSPSREAALASLHQQKITPLHIEEAKPVKKGWSIKNKVKLKDLVIFTRELSTMISAGVALPRSLDTLANQAENQFFKTVINSIKHDVEGGAPLADSMAKYPNVFNEVYVNMIRAGEAGGILDDILKRLATQVEKDASIRKKIRSAMAYPVVIMTVTIIAFFGIMLFIMPKIANIIKQLGGANAKLPIYSQVMLNISAFVQHNIIFILIIAAVGIFWFRRYIKSPKGRYRWHGWLLRAPILGKIITKIVVARFSRTFASLMGAGVSVLESLEVTGKAVGNEVIRKELNDITDKVKNGQPLGKQLSSSKYFPAIVGEMMAVGEETGKMSEILIKVADFYEEEVETVIDGLASIIEPLMIVILGSIVGLIAASVMGPIAGLSKQIGN